MMSIRNIELFGIKLQDISYSEILDSIQQAIQNQKQLIICYANVNSINYSIVNNKIKNLYPNFDIVHIDGFGVFLGAKILYGKGGLSYRLSGSDLYEKLINVCKINSYRIFFFGDRTETLNQIIIKHPQLNVVGTQNGFEFVSTSVISYINQNDPDILIVGLGTPKQEEWIAQNKQSINTNVIIAVGDGIKVFSGTKRRGPKIIQQLGFEWAVRLFFEPKRLWKRYFIGIPLFIFRIIKYKFMNTKTG
jgi:N-acetylglucosaminyldiphosphoundecaprenol N-acetyl-beta-D-mannosaminyltransferase